MPRVATGRKTRKKKPDVADASVVENNDDIFEFNEDGPSCYRDVATGRKGKGKNTTATATSTSTTGSSAKKKKQKKKGGSTKARTTLSLSSPNRGRRKKATNSGLSGIGSQEGEDEKWKFRSIKSHEGPLKKRHPNYNGSQYNVMIEWENGEITTEPLANIAADDPVSCAIYARENNLLNLPGWSCFASVNQKQPPATTTTLKKNNVNIPDNGGKVMYTSSGGGNADDSTIKNEGHPETIDDHQPHQEEISDVGNDDSSINRQRHQKEISDVDNDDSSINRQQHEKQIIGVDNDDYSMDIEKQQQGDKINNNIDQEGLDDDYDNLCNDVNKQSNDTIEASKIVTRKPEFLQQHKLELRAPQISAEAATAKAATVAAASSDHEVAAEATRKDITNIKEDVRRGKGNPGVSPTGGKEKTNLHSQTISEEKCDNDVSNDEVAVETTEKESILDKEDCTKPTATTTVAATVTATATASLIRENLQSASKNDNKLNSASNEQRNQDISKATAGVNNKKEGKCISASSSSRKEVVTTNGADATITTAFVNNKNIRSSSGKNSNVGKIAYEVERQSAYFPREVNSGIKEADCNRNKEAERAAAGNTPLSAGSNDGRENENDQKGRAAVNTQRTIANNDAVINSTEQREAEMRPTNASAASSIVNQSSVSSSSQKSTPSSSSSSNRRIRLQKTFQSVEEGIKTLDGQFFSKLVVCKTTPNAIDAKIRNGASLIKINGTSVKGWCLMNLTSHLKSMDKAEKLVCVFSQFAEKGEFHTTSSSHSTAPSSSSSSSTTTATKVASASPRISSMKHFSVPSDTTRRQVKRSCSSICSSIDTQVPTAEEGAQKKKPETKHYVQAKAINENVGYSARNHSLHDATTDAAMETHKTSTAIMTSESTNSEVASAEKEKGNIPVAATEAASNRDRMSNACDVDGNLSKSNNVTESGCEKIKLVSGKDVSGDDSKKEESQQHQQQQQQKQDHYPIATSSSSSSQSMAETTHVKEFVPPGDPLGITLRERCVVKINSDCKLKTVRIGDMLIKVNEKDVQEFTLEEINSFFASHKHQQRICLFSRQQGTSSSTSSTRSTSPQTPTGQACKSSSSLQREPSEHSSSAQAAASDPAKQGTTCGNQSPDIAVTRKDFVSCLPEEPKEASDAAPAGASVQTGLITTDSNKPADVAGTRKGIVSLPEDLKHASASPQCGVEKQSLAVSSTCASVPVVERTAMDTNKPSDSPDVDEERTCMVDSKQISAASSSCASVQADPKGGKEMAPPDAAEPSPTMEVANGSISMDNPTVDQVIFPEASAAEDIDDNRRSTTAAADCVDDKEEEAVPSKPLSQVKVVVADVHLMKMLTSNLVVWKNLPEKIMSNYTNQIFVDDKLIEIDGENVEGKNLNDVVDVINGLEKSGNKKERVCIFSGLRSAQTVAPVKQTSQEGEESKSEGLTSEEPVSVSSVTEITGALNAPPAASSQRKRRCPPRRMTNSNHQAAANTNPKKPPPKAVDDDLSFCSDSHTENGRVIAIATNPRKRKNSPSFRRSESSSRRNRLPLPFVVVNRTTSHFPGNKRNMADKESEFRNPPRRRKTAKDRLLHPQYHRRYDCEDNIEPSISDSGNRTHDPHHRRRDERQHDNHRTSDHHYSFHNEYIDDKDEGYLSVRDKRKRRRHRLQEKDNKYDDDSLSEDDFLDADVEYSMSRHNQKKKNRRDCDSEQPRNRYWSRNKSSVHEDDYFSAKNRAAGRESKPRRDQLGPRRQRKYDFESLGSDEEYDNRKPPAVVRERSGRNQYNGHRNCYSWQKEDHFDNPNTYTITRERVVGRHHHHRNRNCDVESSDDCDHHDNHNPRAAVVRKRKAGRLSRRDNSYHICKNQFLEDEVENRRVHAIARGYIRSISPQQEHTQAKQFSKEEVEVLLDSVERFGFGKWGQISKNMCNLSGIYFSPEDVKAKATALRDRGKL